MISCSIVVVMQNNGSNCSSGVIDLKAILPKAKENGVKHFIVEQDMVADPETALKRSFDYLNSL